MYIADMKIYRPFIEERLKCFHVETIFTNLQADYALFFLGRRH